MALRGYKPKWGQALWRQIHPDTSVKKTVVKRKSKRRQQLEEYFRKVRLWKLLPVNIICDFPGCQCKTEDCHHTCGKSGLLLLRFEFCVPLCRKHHDWVGANIAAARAIVAKRGLPLICERGKWCNV